MSIYQTIKKYIFILSIFFIFITSIHIVLLYLYDGSTLSPEEGGTVSIGFVGDAPNLNPSLFGLDSSNDYILRFLSRSLLRYNVTTREMEGDIANCNLGKNFSEVKCYVKNDNKWSDGTPITKQDILDTYAFYKTNDNNKPMKQVLANITVVDQGDYISFTGKADIFILDALLYPIIRSDAVDKLNDDKFSLSSFVSSGPYVFEKKEMDVRYGAEKISLIKNNDYSLKAPFIQKYIFKFFHDKNSLLSNKDALNIVFPNEKIDSIPSPRFNKYNYLLPWYLALFLNVERLSGELRNIILFQLGNTAYKNLDENLGKLIHNPFFGTESITPKTLENKNISLAIEKLGYFKKESLVAEFAGKTSTVIKDKPDLNSFFSAPTKQKRFTTSENEVLLSGNTSEGVTNVYINDYQLKGFVPSTRKFFFRAKTDIGTLKEGLNTYALSFEVSGKKIYKETVTIFYSTNKDELDKKNAEFNEQTAVQKAASAADTKKKDEERKIWSGKIAPLDPRYYYNKDLQKFTVNLSFPDQSPYILSLTKSIKESLALIGINTEFKELSWEEFQKNTIKDGKKTYDMLLTGIDLGLSSYNIFPFFHSGQAEKGFNFSKIKNISLDILLERLKSSQLNIESLIKIKQEVLNILRKENVVLTFYSPYHAFLIDKNLKNVAHTDILPLPSFLYDLGENMYMKERRTIDSKKKGIYDLYDWVLKNSPFGSSLIK